MLRNRAVFGHCARCGCPMFYAALLCWDCAQVPVGVSEPTAPTPEQIRWAISSAILRHSSNNRTRSGPASTIRAKVNAPPQTRQVSVAWAVPDDPDLRCTRCGARLLALKPEGATEPTLLCWACRVGVVPPCMASMIAAAVGADPAQIAVVVDPALLAIADEAVAENELENVLTAAK